MACAPFAKEKFEGDALESDERKLQSSIRTVYQTKDIQPCQKVLKALKLESSRRVIIVHLRIAVVNILRKTLIAM